MPKPKSPWLRKDRKVWVAKVGGKTVTLGPDEGAARARWRDLTGEPSGLTVAELCSRYLAWVDGRPELSAVTRKTYREHTARFSAWAGSRLASSVRGWELLDWLNAQPGLSVSSRAAYGAQARRVTRWGRRVGLLAVDPLADCPTPNIQPREATITSDTARQVIAACRTQRLRDLLVFLFATGCRPGEASRLTAADCDLVSGVAVLRRHKTARKTGRPRTIPLVGEAVEVVARLAALHPTGPLFRSRDGKPWTLNALSLALTRAHTRDGAPKIHAYQFRSCWATDAAAAGVPLAVAAQCLGNSTRVLERHYVDLHQRQAEISEGAARVRAG